MKQSYSDKLRDPRWQKTSGIYKLIINGKFYIGSAQNLSARLRSHLNDLKAGRHRNIHLQRAFRKYGDIDFEIIEIILFPELLTSREQSYIDNLKPHYNIAPRAGNMLGFRHSEETKKKISAIQVGRVMSDEARKNYSIAKKGKKLSDEHRKKLSLSKTGDKNPFFRAGANHPQYGIKRSEETRKRISDVLRASGNLRGEKNPASKKGVLYDVNTGENYLFFSLKPLCEKLGINYTRMAAALSRDSFYMNRYYVTHYNVPHQTVL